MPSPHGRAKTLLRELHRRNVYRAGAIFIGAGWGVLQVVDLFIERGFVPEWIFGGALLALALGLPVVLATAWVQGAKSEWEGRDSDADDVPDFLDNLTWKRTVLGGVLAFALLGVVASVYMGMRLLGVGPVATLAAQGVFEAGGTVVLADFESTAGDAAPGDLVTEALRIDLSQSTLFELVAPRDVTTTLALMQHEPSAPLSEEVALDVAARRGATAVVSGEIGRLGGSFVLNARVVATESGAVLASFRTTADSEDDVIEAIDEIARDMRSKIGESLRSVALSEPLPNVTTSSLAALRTYAAARSGMHRDAMNPQAIQRLFQEAVRADSTFAAAFIGLSIAINNYGGDREVAAWAATQAYRFRDRLTAAERLSTEAYYHSSVSGDFVQATNAYRAMVERDSTDLPAVVNLANRLMYGGDYDEAIRVLRSVDGWDTGPWVFNLAVSLAGAGHFDEAVATFDTTFTQNPDNPYGPSIRALNLSAVGRPAEALQLLDGAPLPPGIVAGTQAQAYGVALASMGRLEEAEARFRDAVAIAGAHGAPSQQLTYATYVPLVWSWSGADVQRAEKEFDALLTSFDWASLSSFNRSDPMVAITFAMAGRPERATELLAAYEQSPPGYPDPYAEMWARVAGSLVEVGRAGEEALPELERALVGYQCARCADLYLGYGFELAGRASDAAKAYERYLESRFWDVGDPINHLFASVVHERLGELYEQSGAAARAAQHYARFAELWTDADPALQPRVERARARVEALTAERR